jgi:excisionase family DNA binding protein
MLTEEVAEVLRMDRATVLKYAKCGLIPGKKIGTVWRFSRADIEQIVRPLISPAEVNEPIPNVAIATQPESTPGDGNRLADPEPLPPSSPAPITTLEELERQAVLDAIRQMNGDKVRAARALGIGKSTLYRRLQKYAENDDPELPPW